jgi:peptidoglycan DL-endopeptidase CwlO
MSLPAPVRQSAVLLLALIAGAVAILGAIPSPAASAPGVDPDGSNGTLQQQLTAAAKAYSETKDKLDASKKRQEVLKQQLKVAAAELAAVQATVGTVAAAAYRGKRGPSLTLVLVNGVNSSDALLQSAATIHHLAWRDDQALHRLTTVKAENSRQSEALAAEIKETDKQFAEIAKRRAELDKALGYSSPTGGFTGGTPNAVPAPRNPNGSWPGQSCSVTDPTVSGGCLTPRTLHALTQARLQGFTRYTGCFRGGGWGEHPIGRACDFAAAVSGFGAQAYGEDKIYGDRLAAWLVANADRLGVYYVIWYRQIWMSGAGWRGYSGGGSPAGDHTNHVHLSTL